MAKYLKLFETTSQYNTYINGTPDLPNVSLCEDNNGVYYTALVPVTGITLSPSSLSMNQGETATVTATVTPNDASDKNVTWSTSGSSASISPNGSNVTVTAVGGGTTTITCASASDQTKTATAVVNVQSSGDDSVNSVSFRNDGYFKEWDEVTKNGYYYATYEEENTWINGEYTYQYDIQDDYVNYTAEISFDGTYDDDEQGDFLVNGVEPNVFINQYVLHSNLDGVTNSITVTLGSSSGEGEGFDIDSSSLTMIVKLYHHQTLAAHTEVTFVCN